MLAPPRHAHRHRHRLLLPAAWRHHRARARPGPPARPARSRGDHRHRASAAPPPIADPDARPVVDEASRSCASASACRSTATPRRRSTPCPPASSSAAQAVQAPHVDVVHPHAPYNPGMCSSPRSPAEARRRGRHVPLRLLAGRASRRVRPDHAALARPARRARRRLGGLHRLARPVLPVQLSHHPERHRRSPLLARRRAAARVARGRQAVDPVPRALRPPQRAGDDAGGVSTGACASTRGRCGCASSATGPWATSTAASSPSVWPATSIWAGRVDWSRPRYYASADIHCTPCNRASFGMVLLEAMSSGRPVVASRISGFQLLMEHGRQGLMVSPADDAERFAQALLYLLDRPAERARMGREGRVRP